MPATAQDVLSFWFDELTPEQWFKTVPAVDDAIHTRFTTTHSAASRGELFDWRETANGRLAEIIVLDQFSRNLYRDDPRSFASDTVALVLAQEAIAVGDDQKIPQEHKAFLYMPFMHAESLPMHEIAEKLFDGPGMENNLNSLRSHSKVLQRFGRYPHRNAALGRTSTAEEIEFLKDGRGF